MQIVIEERVAVAVIEIGGRLRGLDAEGVVFNEYGKAPPGLPRISSTSSTTPDALSEAATVVAALPRELSAMVDHVEVLTVDQITLVLRDERIVLWGSSDDSATKAEVLLQLLRQPAKVYDVSVPGQPTTCPEATVEACTAELTVSGTMYLGQRPRSWRHSQGRRAGGTGGAARLAVRLDVWLSTRISGYSSRCQVLQPLTSAGRA